LHDLVSPAHKASKITAGTNHIPGRAIPPRGDTISTNLQASVICKTLGPHFLWKRS
jgi:hypothetical protein